MASRDRNEQDEDAQRSKGTPPRAWIDRIRTRRRKSSLRPSYGTLWWRNPRREDDE